MQREIISLELVLTGSEPKIKRVVEVHKDIHLIDLHEVLQIVFLWENTHLYNFEIGKTSLINLDEEMPASKAALKKKYNTKLNAVIANGIKRMTYFYDFGDSWEVDIKFGKQSLADADILYPRLVSAENASPPDDCGGIPGFYGIAEILADKKHENYGDFKEWLSGWRGLKGKVFDASYVNFENINKPLQKLATRLIPKEKINQKVWMLNPKRAAE